LQLLLCNTERILERVLGVFHVTAEAVARIHKRAVVEEMRPVLVDEGIEGEAALPAAREVLDVHAAVVLGGGLAPGEQSPLQTRRLDVMDGRAQHVPYLIVSKQQRLLMRKSSPWRKIACSFCSSLVCTNSETLSSYRGNHFFKLACFFFLRHFFF